MAHAGPCQRGRIALHASAGWIVAIGLSTGGAPVPRRLADTGLEGGDAPTQAVTMDDD